MVSSRRTGAVVGGTMAATAIQTAPPPRGCKLQGVGTRVVSMQVYSKLHVCAPGGPRDLCCCPSCH